MIASERSDFFIYEALPMRVRFGQGAIADIGRELDELNVGRVLVLSTAEQADVARSIAAAIEERVVGIYAEARMHVPVATADAAASEARRLGADACVAVGGGSTVGLGKAIALQHGLPIIAVPTTFAGSEMTPVWGLTRDEVKETGKDPKVLPRNVIYDPELVASLRVEMCVASGFNAIAHAAEALYAPDASPVIELMAAEGPGRCLMGCPASSKTRAISRLVPRRFEAPGFAVQHWAPRPWAYTTSCVTPLGGLSTFHTLRRTRSSCLMSRRTTWLRPRMPTVAFKTF